MNFVLNKIQSYDSSTRTTSPDIAKVPLTDVNFENIN